MLQVAATTLGAFLFGTYLQRIGRPKRVDWTFLESGASLHESVDAVCKYVEQISAGRCVILSFWNAHSMLLLEALLATPEIRSAMKSFEAVADDTIGGVITQRLYSRAKIATRRIRYGAESNRLTDIKNLIADRPSLALAVDSHGPYREVGLAAARLARTLEADVLPIAASTTFGIRVFKRIRMGIALPRATISVCIGRPIRSSEITLAHLRSEWARSLNELSRQLEG